MVIYASFASADMVKHSSGEGCMAIFFEDATDDYLVVPYSARIMLSQFLNIYFTGIDEDYDVYMSCFGVQGSNLYWKEHMVLGDIDFPDCAGLTVRDFIYDKYCLAFLYRWDTLIGVLLHDTEATCFLGSTSRLYKCAPSTLLAKIMMRLKEFSF